MNDIICDAIAQKCCLEFNYDGYDRIVEPHTLGINKKGHKVLSAYQIAGGSSSGATEGWKLFTVGDIGNLKMSNRGFSGPRQGYNPNDSRMVTIYCCL